MRTPNGQKADNIEKVMLLSMWATHIKKQKIMDNKNHKKFITAGLGKPTYPINKHTVKAFQEYWQQIEKSVSCWEEDPDEDGGSAIDYGDPYGDFPAKSMMAEAMSTWYKSSILPEHILFTVGGIGGLSIIFNVLNGFYAQSNKFRVITPFPHYSAYSNNPHHILHPVNVMHEKGYQLTALALEESIKLAYQQAEIDGILPRAVLICNPSNPLGTVLSTSELEKISKILAQYKELHIILDEAYAEMAFAENPSFLEIAPELKNRTIILRSATKALSAAGERMAVIIAFDPSFMKELVTHKISSYIHAPRSSQIAYAKTMNNFSEKDRKEMADFYKIKVDYVSKRLKEMGAAMPSSDYEVQGTFYVLGDFNDLLGLELPNEVNIALGNRWVVRSGEDIAYYLMFKDLLMLAPLSYFGLERKCGILRITCSHNQKNLEEMMDRLENRLLYARKIKNDLKIKSLCQKSKEMIISDSKFRKKLTLILNKSKYNDDTCLSLRKKNITLSELSQQLNDYNVESSPA